MGSGLSTALGKDGLSEENKVFLDSLLQRLSGVEYNSEHLDLANRFLCDEGVRSGCRVLKYNRQIRSLDLASNQLTIQSFHYLIEAIEENGSITSLNLAGNPGLGDAACVALAEYLKTNPPLEELSLYHCNITDEGLEALVNGLMYNTNLAVLRLEMNQLTDASLEMLLQLVTSCENKSLGHVTLAGNPGPFDEAALLALKRATAEGRDTLVAKHEAAAARAAEEHRRKLADEERRTQVELTKIAQREAAEREAEEMARLAQQEEELLQQQELENERKRKNLNASSAYAKEASRRSAAEQQQRAIETAYQWRDTLTRNGELVREWRDGFTVMQTKPGEPPGTVPSVVAEHPRRLKACWCDPHDVSAPYAKTLHYHCKYEAQARSLADEEMATGGKYTGCRASGHCCATVGFFAKPLPDTSAAHFFASAHPTATL